MTTFNINDLEFVVTDHAENRISERGISIPKESELLGPWLSKVFSNSTITNNRKNIHMLIKHKEPALYIKTPGGPDILAVVVYKDLKYIIKTIYRVKDCGWVKNKSLKWEPFSNFLSNTGAFI